MKKIKKLSLKKEVIASLSQKEQNDALGGIVATVAEQCDKTLKVDCIVKTINGTECTRCIYCPIDPGTIVVIPTTDPINPITNTLLVCQTGAALCN